MLLRKKSASLLIALLEKPYYVSELARRANVTFVYANNMCNLLKKKGLVKFDKKRKMKYVYLTEKGKKIAECLKKIDEVC